MTGRREHYLSLVIPIFNGAACLRRSWAELQTAVKRWEAELILVNDGSTDETASVLASLDPAPTVVNLPRNRGKGQAVAEGMRRARGRFRFFTDVDLDYPLEQLESFVAALEAGADLVIASRVMEESRFELRTSTIPYVHSRHRLSRVFNALVRLTLLPGLLDTQAGFKGFTAVAAEALFAELRCESFAFDLEILARARRLGFSIVELPVTFRYREDPSTFKLMRHGALLMRDLARLILIHRLGRST